MPGIFFNNYIDGVQQALKIPLFDKRRPEIRHDEIAHEENALVRQVDEHCIVSFASLHGNQLDARSPDLQLSAAVNGNVRLEAAHVVQAEAFPKELFVENPRSFHFTVNLLLIIAPGIETRARIQSLEIGVAANVVPVSMRDEDGREFRQARGK